MAGEQAIFIVIFIGVLFLIAASNRKTRAKAAVSLSEATDKVNELRQKVLVVSSTAIPGKEIKQVLGQLSGTSSIEASRPEEADAAEQQAMLNLMEKAQAMGANAVIDAKLTSSSHQKQGSKWMVSKAYYTGTAVII